MNGTVTIAIIPVKRRENANQRLDGALPASERAALAEAMFLDVLGNVRRCARIDEIIVVTADPAAARTARWLEAEVLEQERDEGHSEAATAGVRQAQARGAERVALLPADCPMLDPLELNRKLGSVPRRALIVPDRHRTGTNALVLSPPDIIEPAFGPDSCARHISRARAAGVSFAIEEVESLALDLDTPEDLVELRDALVLNPERAPRTAELIWKLEPKREESAPEAA